MRLRWVGNKSRHYNGKQKDVPVQCIGEEDRSVPLQVRATVHMCGARVWVWTGVVVEILEPLNALELALLVKRTCHKLEVR